MRAMNHPELETLAPPLGDGRNFDRTIAEDHGEGAAIAVRAPDVAWPIPAEARPAPDAAPSETYYDLPVVKAAPWKWYVPAYFHAGGVAGAAASLAGAIQLSRDPRLRALEGRLHWLAVLGEAAGGALLIADLGRPSRFHHMMRVLRPSSPMNLGTWILSAAGTTGALALVSHLRSRDHGAPRATLGGIGGAIAGTLLSTYTGVLLGNTAIPVWHATRRRLPPWFAALSAAGLGAALELAAPATGREARVTRVYSAVAKAAELAGARGLARSAGRAGVDGPFRSGRAARMWRASRWLGVASLAATLWPGGGRTRRAIAGVLGTAAAVLSRFAIVEAGRHSAADPRATFLPQRAGE
ncbi:MAG TPA: NrfD/PsrC family molybdoenzyme membrane anchor subunit [Kofleriaceae bacterium]